MNELSQIITIFIKQVTMITNKRNDYLAPQCLIVQMSEATYLMETSFPSQHRPAIHGEAISSAKASLSWEEDEDLESLSWED